MNHGPTIEKSYAIGSIKIENGTTNVGGVIGVSNCTTINNTYGAVNIIGTGDSKNIIGGLIGASNYTNINNTYAIGKIEVTSGKKGGLIGSENRSTTINSYYSSELTGLNISASGESKKIQEMLYAPSYINWDFDTIWLIDTNGGSLPYLRNMVKPNEVLKDNLSCEGLLDIEYSGSGIKEDPFIIDSMQKLQNINSNEDSFRKNAYYALACDLDGTDFKNFEPIGTNTEAFTGTLDGNGHKISNLNIDSEKKYVGLFGYIRNGTIKNLTLENETVKGSKGSADSYTYIGGLVGYNELGTIEMAKITGISKIEDSSMINPYIGGLIGCQIAGTVKKSYVEGEIITASKNTIGNIGGLIGYVEESAIIKENNNKIKITNNITGPTNVGGLLGYSISNAGIPTISKSYSKVYIDCSKSGNTNMGGLIGYIEGKNTIIEESYSIGDIKLGSAKTKVGGLIGYAQGAQVNNVYTNVNIEGIGNNSSNIAGLIEECRGTQINNTYAIGKINVEFGTKAGLVSETISSKISNSYWSPEVTKLNSWAGKEARRFQEMLYEDNYKDWNFGDIWKIEENGKSLPYLLNNKEVEILEEHTKFTKYMGEGTEESPYLIYTMEQLQNITNTAEAKYYKIMNDIDASTYKDFEPIGANEPFTGTLDGNGHKISNLNIESSKKYVGLFGYIDDGTVRNLNLENVTIKSSGTEDIYVGGLSGFFTALENRSYTFEAENRIEGINIEGINIEIENPHINEYVGGLIGSATGTIDIVSAQNVNIISTQERKNLNMGGLIGYANPGAFDQMYSTGNLIIEGTGNKYIGGLIGYCKAHIRSNYTHESDTVTNAYSIVDINSADGAIRKFDRKIRDWKYF